MTRETAAKQIDTTGESAKIEETMRLVEAGGHYVVQAAITICSLLDDLACKDAEALAAFKPIRTALEKLASAASKTVPRTRHKLYREAVRAFKKGLKKRAAK